MSKISRRAFMEMSIALGATAAWGRTIPSRSKIAWRERRDFFPEGVASGDPDSNSVLLWTRRPPAASDAANHAIEKLSVEVSEDEAFTQIIATAEAPISEASDWTCRVLVGGLKPAHVYWYRFTDADGNGSRIGRTITAPADDDPRPVRFAFVSCQNANQGAQNAYRRMIYEDERAAEEDRLGFVLHLGDFIYEIVWYPEDRPQGMYDRHIRDIVRYEHGEKDRGLSHPDRPSTTIAPSIEPICTIPICRMRAHAGLSSTCGITTNSAGSAGRACRIFEGKTRPAQTRKVAANQAFFEYQPARMANPAAHRSTLRSPASRQTRQSRNSIEHGLGQEPNNLIAIHSLKGYRALRWGRNVELIITDQRSYRSEEPAGSDEADAFCQRRFS